MADYNLLIGSTSVRLRVQLFDSSNALTTLTYTSANLVIGTQCDNETADTSYTQAGGTIEDITTPGTYAAPTATKCRFKAVDVNLPGVYEIQLADARFAVASAKWLNVTISGATGLISKTITVQLNTPVNLTQIDGVATLDGYPTLQLAQLVLDNSGLTGPSLSIAMDSTSPAVLVQQTGTGLCYSVTSTGADAIRVTGGGSGSDGIQISGNATGADIRLAGTASVVGNFIDSSNDLYDFVLDFRIDDASSRDEYSVTWRKNGVRQTAVTLGKIQVIKRDGTDLVAADTNMTQIAALGMWKYDATTTQRTTDGDAVWVECKATIDAAVRTWGMWVGRDG
jgi:hypothetical protein